MSTDIREGVRTVRQAGAGGRRDYTGANVFDAAIDRLCQLYEGGHRVIVSFSAGKDSGVCLELAIIAATMTDRLPVDVVMRDEEVMFPGTFEYAERVAQRPEVRFHWLIANQPIINCFNRAAPYFWTFDPLLDPSEWVRQPPDIAQWIEDKDITRMVSRERYPPPEGKDLFAVIGLRADESTRRKMSIHSAGGFLTKPNRVGVRNVRPIYDWLDSDVWKAVRDNGWDYNSAYSILLKMGVPRRRQRIAPPTMNAQSVDLLRIAAAAWPSWWERVCDRLPGLRTAAMFGKRAIEPERRLGETWQETFERECVERAPDWIADRARRVSDAYVKTHRVHSTSPFPDSAGCAHCTGGRLLACWKGLTKALYGGDPFCLRISPTMGGVGYVEPEFFRAGAGTWGGGKPTFG